MAASQRHEGESRQLGNYKMFLLFSRFPLPVQENAPRTPKNFPSLVSDSFRITVLWTRQYQHTLVAVPFSSEPILSESVKFINPKILE